MTRVTREYRFAASHRLHSDLLPAADNQRIFGKCNNPYGHGHDYVLQVSVSGPVDPDTGLVCRLAAIDAVVEQQVLRHVRDQDLNCWDEFASLVPTTENLAVVVRRRLSGAWQVAFPDGPGLCGVRILETKRNTVEWRLPCR
ncbi:MAG: 6-pyruvoyl tetrahydrobiopterin synthase [Acidobacteria bacterium]|nr:6-pyruvoyl tetrahydrobiopterin synthase [Acidobacteriota bacterium]